MPVYIGKSIDTFEDVWNMWMRSAGVDDLIPADIMSFRCFAYSLDEDVKRWFSPMQPVCRALEELCSSLGIKEVCSIIPASVWGWQSGEPEWPVLLADICLGVEIPAVREKFYHGAPPFCLLYRHDDGKHLICSSSGAPFIELTEKEVMERISDSEGYVLTGKMPMRIWRTSAEEILHKGIQWRRSVLHNQDGINQAHSDLFKREWDRASRLSLQYGMMNYQIQLSKVVRFCAEEIQVSGFITEELNKLLLKIGSICRSCAYEKIIGIDRDFWALIESIEENNSV